MPLAAQTSDSPPQNEENRDDDKRNNASKDDENRQEPDEGQTQDKATKDEHGSNEAPNDDSSTKSETSKQKPPKKGLIPPRLIKSSPPEFPAGHATHEEHPTVVVNVVIGKDGKVQKAAVEHGAGKDFDREAIRAVEKWLFEPATRDGDPIVAKVRVAVHFELPSFDVATALDSSENNDVNSQHVHVDQSAQEEHSHREHGAPSNPHHGEEQTSSPTEKKEPEETPAFEATARVDAERMRDEKRSAAEYQIESEDIQDLVVEEGADVLRSAPGFFLTKPEGDAGAHRIQLRGFDAEHGQDIEFRLGGIPLNVPAHIHGQGYADLNLVLAGTIDRLQVLEGVYDAKQGDFAVAGSAYFDLGVEDRGLKFRLGYGSFDRINADVIWAPEDEAKQTFAAFRFSQSEGFGSQRAGTRATAQAQYMTSFSSMKLRLLGITSIARSDLAGVLRKDDVDARNVGFYDVYDFSTAKAQNTSNLSLLLGAFASWRGEKESNGELGIWLAMHNYRLQQNFTGFNETSRYNPEWKGRGDLIEQSNRILSLGLDARHRTKKFELTSFARAQFDVGLSARVDQTTQVQNLLAAPQNETWDERVDADIVGADVGLYAEFKTELWDLVTTHAGYRMDALLYNVDDRLENFVPRFRRESYLAGHRRSAFGIQHGPRLSFDVQLLDGLKAQATYGEGFRSPQPRLLADGESAPFAKVQGGDAGLRYEKGDWVSAQLSGFYTHVSDDIAFEAREGALTRVGPTQRVGFSLNGHISFAEAIKIRAALTYVDATLQEPPFSTAEEPSPPFEKGQNLPQIAPWNLRIDASAKHRLYRLSGADLMGNAALAFSYLSKRPLPYGEFSDPVALFDIRAGIAWRDFDIRLDIFNLFDRQYAAQEYVHSSDWSPSSPPSRLPTRHIAAGAPRTFLLSVGAKL